MDSFTKHIADQSGFSILQTIKHSQGFTVVVDEEIKAYKVAYRYRYSKEVNVNKIKEGYYEVNIIPDYTKGNYYIIHIKVKKQITAWIMDTIAEYEKALTLLNSNKKVKIISTSQDELIHSSDEIEEWVSNTLES